MNIFPLEQSSYPPTDEVEVTETTIGAVLGDAVSRWGARPALIEGLADGSTGRRWTFGELAEESEHLARKLAGQFTKGERIAVWAPNLPEWVILEYACALTGLVLVTINPGYVSRELDYVLRQSGASALFLVKEHRGNPMAETAAKVVAEIPAVRMIVDLEDADAFTGLPDGELPEVEPNDPAQIQYTSGTTGFPKGVVLSHRNLVNNARHYYGVSEAERGLVTLGMTPLFHTTGCSMAVLGAVQIGSPLVLLHQFDPHSALDLIEAERVELFLGVPTMLIGMCAAQRARPRDLSTARTVVCGGAMVAPELVRDVTELMGVRFITAYGQTESAPLLTMTRPEDAFEDICGTIGRPMPQTEIAIMKPGTSEIVECGTVGEICARSYAVMIGYHDNPEATAQAIDKAGWLRTGDLGTMDERGFVSITGRVKDMIIRGGENLFPAEIENVLLEHEDVAEVAVVGVPDPLMGEEVAAFLRLAPGASLDPAGLKAHCRERMAAQKCPAHWITVDSWPMTGSGKIQKFALRDQWIAANP